MVRRIGKVAGDCRSCGPSAATWPAAPPISRPRPCNNTRVAGAILQGRRVRHRAHDIGERLLDLVEHELQASCGAGACVLGAARHDAVHHQAMPKVRDRRRQHAFAEDAAMGVDDRERGVVADRPDIAQMVGDPLELGHDAAQDLGAWRRINLHRPLDRAGEGEAVGTVESRRCAPPLFAARSMSVSLSSRRCPGGRSEPFLQPHHGLAVALKRKWPGSMMPACTGQTGI